MVMAIGSSGGDHARHQEMCESAGHGLPTRFSVEHIVPAAATPGPAMVRTETVFEGRASLTQPAALACAMPEGARPLSVPIFADATLREGDIVAMADGFRVFVGRGGPPYDDADFVSMDPRHMARDLRGMTVAGTPR